MPNFGTLKNDLVRGYFKSLLYLNADTTGEYIIHIGETSEPH